jgi:hypothetical protein
LKFLDRICSLHCRNFKSAALAPHDFAVRVGAVRQERRRVHRIPRPTSVTIAKRPSQWERDGLGSEVIWVRDEAKYFLREDWTTQINLIQLAKSAFTRKRILHLF